MQHDSSHRVPSNPAGASSATPDNAASKGAASNGAAPGNAAPSLVDPVAGIDVSKPTLDCFVDVVRQRFQFANDGGGIAQLIARFHALKVRRVVIEATGRLHRRVAADLTQAGIDVVLVNPQRAREFARSVGRLEKTDRVDAEALALFARAGQHRVMAKPSEKQVELDDLLSRRRALIEIRIAEKNRLGEEQQPKFAKAQAQKLVRVIEQQIEDLDRVVAKLIDGDGDWKRKAEIISSIPGVSTGTANQLIADLPELGAIDRQGIAKLAGVAPLNDDSGNRSGKRRIKGGRQPVRNALYMAAFNAVRHCERFKQFAQRLRQAGKPYKVALTAAMRKLLVTINQMIKTDSLYDPKRALPS